MRVVISCLGLAVFALVAATALAADAIIGHWNVVAHSVTTGCTDGECGRFKASTSGAFVGSPDGSFVSDPFIMDCTDLPKLEGTWKLGSRGRYVLKPSNGRDFKRALGSCNSVKLHGGLRAWFKPSEDGTTATGRIGFSGSASGDGVLSSFTAVAKLQAQRVIGSPSGAFLQ